MYSTNLEALALVDGLAAEMDIELFPNLRIRNGTDGLESLAAGYQTVSICSCTEHKQPAQYHWPNDISANVDFGTVDEAIRLSEAIARRLGSDWL
jgi:hypothetical protein